MIYFIGLAIFCSEHTAELLQSYFQLLQQLAHQVKLSQSAEAE